jgi:hypothetical protein
MGEAGVNSLALLIGREIKRRLNSLKKELH